MNILVSLIAEFMGAAFLFLIGLVFLPGIHLADYPSPYSDNFQQEMDEAKQSHDRAFRRWLVTVALTYLVVAVPTLAFHWVLVK